MNAKIQAITTPEEECAGKFLSDTNKHNIVGMSTDVYDNRVRFLELAETYN